ncbi:MAG: hypothetical protein HFG57_11540, partial [Lachnospiraceae bacterium]|nr:hypothetical protein [Lachnospiraceae bacterium]
IAQSGAGELVARWALSRKAIQGRPLLFSFIFLFILRMISAVSNPLGMILLGWAIIEGVANVLKQDLSKKYFRCMTVFVVVSCVNGDMIIPFKTWLTAMWNAFGEMLGEELNFMAYLMIVFIFGTLTELACIAFIRFAKVDVLFMKDMDNEVLAKGNTRLNSRQTAYFIAMLISIIIGLSGYIFPPANPLCRISKTLTMAGVFSVAVAVLILLRDKDGQPMLDWKKTMAPGAFWGSFFIIAAAIPLSSALISESTGFSVWLTSVLGPAFRSSSIFEIYLLVMVCATLLTNIASNAGIGMMLLPIVLPVADAAGANKFVVGICCIMSACFGLMTPGGSAAAALIFGSKDQLKVKIKDIMGYSAMFILFYFAIGAVVFPVLDKLIR